MSKTNDEIAEIKNILSEHSQRIDKMDQRMDKMDKNIEYWGNQTHRLGILFEESERNQKLILEKLDMLINEKPSKKDVQEKLEDHDMRISNLEIAYKSSH